MKIIVLVCALLLALSKESEAQLSHDIRADSILAPHGKTPVGFPTPFRARLTNVGSSNEVNVGVMGLVRDRYGVMYRDTAFVGTWMSGQTVDVTFANFTPQFNGIDTICALSILSSDQNHANDMTCGQFGVAYGDDAQAMSIQYPKLNDSIRIDSAFRPIAVFRNIGVEDVFNVPVRLELRRCSDGGLVFREDTFIDMYADSSLVQARFPSRQGPYNTSTLPPGCYRIAAIARAQNDGDHSNDTVYSTFTIYPIYTHDISADAVLSPAPNQRISSTFPGFTVRFANAGSSRETNVPIWCWVRDKIGMVYRDTVSIGALNSGQTIDLLFNSMTPWQTNGPHEFCAVALLSSDQNHSNDTVCGQFIVAYSDDAQAVAIQYPKANDSIPAGVGFQPVAIFQNVGVNEIRNGPAKVVVRRCADQMLVAVFQQTNLNIPVDSLMSDTFPSQQGSFNTKFLPPGCYQIAAIARIPNDGDVSNDTAYSTFTIYATHDISADSILSPPPNQRIALGWPAATKARFTNRGVNAELNVYVIFRITRITNGPEVVYVDTNVIASIKSGQTQDMTFTNWIPQQGGIYEFCAAALLPSDQDRMDDSTCDQTVVAYQNDAQAVAIQYPKQSDSLLAGVGFQPIAVFRNVGVNSLASAPAQLVIRRCSDNVLAALFQNTIPNLPADSSLVADAFPSKQASFDTKLLPPGCYQIAAIARAPGDGDHSNDTAFSSFMIVAQSDVMADDGPSHDLVFRGMFPNPTSTTTTLAYSLPESGDVTLRLLDVTGREVLRSTAREDAGGHQSPIQTPGLEPGIYLCQLTFVNARGEVSRAYTKMIVSGMR